MICECTFPGCPVHTRSTSTYRIDPCPAEATMIVTRSRGDFEGTIKRFCAGCAFDAIKGDGARDFTAEEIP
jgi:hypothetical protein